MQFKHYVGVQALCACSVVLVVSVFSHSSSFNIAQIFPALFIIAALTMITIIITPPFISESRRNRFPRKLTNSPRSSESQTSLSCV
jgi:hypothetical protein